MAYRKGGTPFFCLREGFKFPLMVQFRTNRRARYL